MAARVRRGHSTARQRILSTLHVSWSAPSSKLLLAAVKLCGRQACVSWFTVAAEAGCAQRSDSCSAGRRRPRFCVLSCKVLQRILKGCLMTFHESAQQHLGDGLLVCGVQATSHQQRSGPHDREVQQHGNRHPAHIANVVNDVLGLRQAKAQSDRILGLSIQLPQHSSQFSI